MTVFAEDYRVADWRELDGLGLHPIEEGERQVWMGVAGVENLLAGRFQHDERELIPGDMIVQRASGYLFSCEFDGLVRGPEDREEELYLLDEIPFAEMQLFVPINAPDPVKTARSLAAREIKLTECAQARVTPYDWRREKFPENAEKQPLDQAHRVVLKAAWRRLSA